MRWFIADTHFGHKNVIAFDGRPFDTIHDHDECLIDRWNKRVGDGDIVYHLGDFSLCPFEKTKAIFDRLKGIKVLVIGNHDGSIPRNERIGWKFVCKGLMIMGQNGPIWMVHDPMEAPMFEDVIHGHTHKPACKTADVHKRICVSANLINYGPISENQIFKALKRDSLC